MPQPIDIIRLSMILTILALAGCGPRTIELKTQARPSNAAAQIDWSDWGLTLSRIVQDDRVDYRRLQEDPQPLDRFLALVARVGPETTPGQFSDRDAKLAYAINCYNATIVRSILALNLPARAPLDLENRYRFTIDGQLRTPADLRRMALELAPGDWRVPLTLCDGTLEGPPLWRRVYLPDMMDAQLTRVAKDVLMSPEILRIDHGAEKQLVFWRGLYAIKDDLIRDYERRNQTSHATLLNALGEWSNRTRREELNAAVGYAVVPMASDRRINHFEPPKNIGLLSNLGGLPGS
jgi:hypothetical protein